jgi:hypothetical protein
MKKRLVASLLCFITNQSKRRTNFKFTVHGTVHRQMFNLYNQRDATYTMFFIFISSLHVSGGFSAHYQELIKLYVQR